MKKVLLLISVLMLPIFLTAQDDELDLPFDNQPLTEASRSYFVLAGGVTFDWLMIKEDHLNSFFNNELGDLQLSGPIQLTGGQGATGIPWVKNLRLGVFGYGGSVESEVSTYKGTNIDGSETGIDGLVQSKLTASMFGFSVHYGYVPFEHFAILAGVNAGWGDMTYEFYNALSVKENEFSDNGTNRLVKNYFFAMPNIQLEYALANFIIIRADATYNLTIGQDTDWTYNTLGTNSVNPDFDLSGLKIGFGVMVGLVNF